MRSSTVSNLAAVLLLTLAATSRAAELPAKPERLTDRQAVEAYLAVVEDEGQTALVRNYAAQQIIRRGDKALPHVMTLYRTADVSRRGILADVLVGLTTTDEKVKTLLLDDLKTTGADIDPRVIRVLGLMEVDDAVGELLRILPATTGETRLAVLCALGRLADERAIDPLVAGLDSDERLVRSHCAAGVVKILEKLKPEGRTVKTPQTYESLFDKVLAYARSGRHEDVRRILITGTGRMGDERAAPALRRLLQREADSIRASAAEALGMLKDRRAVDGLLELAREDNAYVKRAAVRALGDIGDPGSVPALTSILETCDAKWRREVVSALRKITGEPYGNNPAQWRHWWEKER